MIIDKNMEHKKFFISLIMVLSVFVLSFVANCFLPYKPNDFVVDGTNFAASVENGNSVVLTLENDGGEWLIEKTPEIFKSDYGIKGNKITEYRLVAIKKGTDTMELKHIKEDGSEETYALTLQISLHKKKYLQIDEFYFQEMK